MDPDYSHIAAFCPRPGPKDEELAVSRSKTATIWMIIGGKAICVTPNNVEHITPMTFTAYLSTYGTSQHSLIAGMIVLSMRINGFSDWRPTRPHYELVPALRSCSPTDISSPDTSTVGSFCRSPKFKHHAAHRREMLEDLQRDMV